MNAKKAASTEARDSRLAELLAQAKRYDDSALEHLANKGLVRRAKKLVDGTAELSVGATGIGLSGSDWTVSFGWDLPLNQAQCICATAGVCQHLLAGIVHLRDYEQPDIEAGGLERSLSADEIRRVLLELGDDELQAWAKQTDCRWAIRRIASIDPDEIGLSGTKHVTIELPPPYASVRFLTPLLEEAIVKPPGPNDRRSVALAILALWLTQGREMSVQEGSGARPVELVAARIQVTQRAERLCQTLLITGLLHLGEADREKLDSLAASARGVKLYRLSILAERAADHVDALGALSPEADSARLLEQLSEIAVVAEALQALLAEGKQVPDGLAGLARAHYQPVGHLDLVGLGHYSWGDDRFAGSTAVLAESAKRIFSVARPRRVNGQILPEAMGWQGAGSVSSLAGRRVSLSNAQLSDQGRLSGSESVTASLGRQIGRDNLESLAWSGERPASASRLLGQKAPNWAVLCVEGEVSPIGFDSITQELEWVLWSEGQEVHVRLLYRPSSLVAVQNLERLASTGPPDFVVGRLSSRGTGLDLWPISLFVGGELCNLASPIEQPAEGGAPSPEVSGEQPVLLVSHLDRLSARLVRLADGGRRPSRRDLLLLASEASSWGFPVIDGVISKAPTDARGILRASWVIQLLRVSMPVSR